MPSLSLLEKISNGGVDPVKKGRISEDVILMIDEMYLQKSEEYYGGEIVGCDDEGKLYKGLVGFMIVGLKQSIPYIIKSIPETKIEGEWLKEEILKSIETLHSINFKVRGIVADNHSTNVSACSKILCSNGFDKNDLAVVTKDGSKFYLFFDSVHLMKNIRNNLLNNKWFLFPAFSFSGFYDQINCDGGEISWKLFHDVYEKDEKLQSNWRKAPKISVKVIHPGNNKQSLPLALAIFHETTSAAITSYFPERSCASNVLKLINAWWVVSNSKTEFNSNNRLGNAAILGDNKPTFLRALADWIEEWKDESISNCERFTLTENTSSALKRTLRCTASLIEDLLSEGYEYVLTSRYQSDPLERRFSQYRQMSGGRFLVGLREVNSSEKILKIRGLLKENINLLEEDLQIEVNQSDAVGKLIAEVRERWCDMDDVSLSPYSREVAIYISGKYIKRVNCSDKCKMVGTISDDSSDRTYLQAISRGGLMIPSLSLSEYVCGAFAAIEFFNDTIKSSVLTARLAAETVLKEIFEYGEFLCNDHQDYGLVFINKIITNIFYNNERKLVTDNAFKDDVAAFKNNKRSNRKLASDV